MRRLTLRMIVSSLTFVISIAAASLGLASRRHAPVPFKLETSAMAVAPSPSPAKPERTYKREFAGQGSERSRGASFITLISSDGMRFRKWTTLYGSPQRANSVLERKLSKALKIISREPMLDKNNKQIGEIVVAKFATKNQEAGPASLFWTEDSIFYEVDSSSVENILEYRKDFHH